MVTLGCLIGARALSELCRPPRKFFLLLPWRSLPRPAPPNSYRASGHLQKEEFPAKQFPSPLQSRRATAPRSQKRCKKKTFVPASSADAPAGSRGCRIVSCGVYRKLRTVNASVFGKDRRRLGRQISVPSCVGARSRRFNEKQTAAEWRPFSPPSQRLESEERFVRVGRKERLCPWGVRGSCGRGGGGALPWEEAGNSPSTTGAEGAVLRTEVGRGGKDKDADLAKAVTGRGRPGHGRSPRALRGRRGGVLGSGSSPRVWVSVSPPPLPPRLTPGNLSVQMGRRVACGSPPPDGQPACASPGPGWLCGHRRAEARSQLRTSGRTKPTRGIPQKVTQTGLKVGVI